MTEEEPFVSKEDYERLMSQGKKEDMERLFEYELIKFKETGKREDTIKVGEEYAKVINPEVEAPNKIWNKSPEEIFDFLIEVAGVFDKYGKLLGFDNERLNFELSQIIIKRFRIFTFSDTTEIFMYSTGVYEDGEKKIQSFIQKILNKYSKIHGVNEILAHIRRQTYKKRVDVLEEKDKICLENGILDLKSLEILQHSPELIFFNKIPVNYINLSDCPKIKKFLSEIVYEEDILILQELAGYCLFKNYFIHKAIMLVGTGANGKSTFINLLKAFLGQENCVSVPLHYLEEDKFALSSLHGKLANLFADLPSRALKNTSFFKMLVGEDFIPAEKKFKDKFFFTNYAKQIFSTNQIPRSPEESDAFFRRWIILNFPNQFFNSKADKKLINKLTTPEELSGFLNFALEGLKRLMEKEEFSNTKSVNEIRENYIRLSDSVSSFIMDCVQISPENFVPKKEIYTAYAEYCREINAPIITENIFHKELQKKIRIEDYRPVLDKLRVQCWKGLTYTKYISKEKNVDRADGVDINNQNSEKESNPVNDVNDVNSKTSYKDDLNDKEIDFSNLGLKEELGNG